jgi:hypothetical protein
LEAICSHLTTAAQHGELNRFSRVHRTQHYTGLGSKKSKTAQNRYPPRVGDTK